MPKKYINIENLSVSEDFYNFINNDMNEKYNVYLVSDSTGETLDRIFLSLKSQFANFEYEKKEFAFMDYTLSTKRQRKPFRL